MKAILTLAVLLFVYPWNSSSQQEDELLFEGMYTITGRSYNDMQTYDSPAGCQAVYVKAYKGKLIVTMSVYGSVEYVDVQYIYEKTDSRNCRIYRNGNMDAFIVDTNQDMQRVMTTFIYNGNKRIDTFCEMVKGDYSADCLKRMEDALKWERMKSTLDLNYGY